MQITEGVLCSIVFIGYLVLWAIKRREVLQATGEDVKVLKKSRKPAQIYFKKLEKIMTISIIFIIFFQVLFAEKYIISTEISILKKSIFNYIGIIISILGLLICRIAQVTIGKSWRVGIDENAKLGLVKNGFYKYVRNPTYSGLYIMLTGVWLIIPTFLFSLWFLAFFLMMEFQVRMEEEYLKTVYGKDYIEYCKTTKRYFPLLY